MSIFLPAVCIVKRGPDNALASFHWTLLFRFDSQVGRLDFDENQGLIDAMAFRGVPVADRELDVTAERCFLCARHFRDGLAATLDHLRDAHGFAVPLPHKCRDLPGLYEYLCVKVNGLLCLV